VRRPGLIPTLLLALGTLLSVWPHVYVWSNVKPKSILIHFPQYLPPPPDKVGESILMPTAGKLILQNNCLRVAEKGRKNSILLIWAGHFSFSVKDKVIQVKYPPENYKMNLKLGDFVIITGGNVYQSKPSPAVLAEAIPYKCPGPYVDVAHIDTLKTEPNFKRLFE
jgi:hypothetical protein